MAVDTGFLLYKMQQTGALTDITFHIQGTEFKAHRNVISCRGGKLQDIVEEDPKHVVIENITLETFSTVLE